MKGTILLAGLLSVLLAPAAFAADGGFYLALHGGGTLLEGMKNESDTGTFNFEAKEGWHAGVAIGYDLRDAYPDIGTGRVELEVTSRQNDFDEYEDADIETEGTGKIKAESVMLNTIGEYRESLPWIPYIGIGAGAARVTFDQIRTTGTLLADDEDIVFAYQGLAGVGVQLACRLYLDLGYRYFATLDPEFTDATTGAKADSEYASHNLSLGMRVDF